MDTPPSEPRIRSDVVGAFQGVIFVSSVSQRGFAPDTSAIGGARCIGLLGVESLGAWGGRGGTPLGQALPLLFLNTRARIMYDLKTRGVVIFSVF